MFESLPPILVTYNSSATVAQLQQLRVATIVAKQKQGFAGRLKLFKSIINMFRQVGPACNPGIPHRVVSLPLSEGPTSLLLILSGGGVSGVRNKPDVSNFSGGHPLKLAGLPIKHLLGAKNGWGT